MNSLKEDIKTDLQILSTDLTKFFLTNRKEKPKDIDVYVNSIIAKFAKVIEEISKDVWDTLPSNSQNDYHRGQIEILKKIVEELK